MRRRKKNISISFILTAALILSIFNVPMVGYAAGDSPGTLASEYGIFQYGDESDVQVVSPKKINLATLWGDPLDYYYVDIKDGGSIYEMEPTPDIRWESSNEAVADCSSEDSSFNECKVTYLSRGATTITAYVNNEEAASFQLKIVAVGVQSATWWGDIPTIQEVNDGWEEGADWSYGEDDVMELEIGPFVEFDSDYHNTTAIRAFNGKSGIQADWSVEDTSIARYGNDRGYDYLEPLKEGTTKLTATQKGTTDTVSVTLKVIKPVRGGTDNKAWFIKDGDSAALYGFDGDWNGIIPENVTIDSTNYPVTTIRDLQTDDPKITTLSIPKTIKTIEPYAFYSLTKLKNINVSNDNEEFCSEEGILFLKSPKALFFYPAGRTNADYSIPEGTDIISEFAFDNEINTRYLRNIYVPESVLFNEGTTICFPQNESGKYTITLCNIMGNNSSVREYAEEYDIPYKAVSSLKAPTSTSTTLYSRYNGMKFSWNRSKDAKGYYVYYKKATASTWNYLTQTTGTSISKTSLASGTKYSFRVYPYMVNNGEKCISKFYKEGVGTYTLKTMSRPSISKRSSKYIKVKWSKVYGNTGYQIARSKYKTKKFTVVKTVSNKYTYTKIKAKKKKTYYYKVRTYKTVGKSRIYGPWSSAKAYKLR